MQGRIVDGASVRWIAMIMDTVVTAFACAKKVTPELIVVSSQTRRCHTSASSTVLLIVSKRALLYSKHHPAVMVRLELTIATTSALNHVWMSANKGVFLGLLERAPCLGFDVLRACVMDG